MTHAILTLAHALALSAGLTPQEAEQVARWQEHHELIEPLGIDADAFQRALEFGDEILPEDVRTILIAGLVEALHVVWSEGALPQRGRADWLLRRIGVEGSPFRTVSRLFGVSRATMAKALDVTEWQVRKLCRPDWVDVVQDDHDEALERLGMLLAQRLEDVERKAA
ncbi:MAG: hypothetical protein JSR83_08450 [Proteobacteria bacterium]|nr:hypothetical protein [Pseudomonadota bacterium]